MNNNMNNNMNNTNNSYNTSYNNSNYHSNNNGKLKQQIADVVNKKGKTKKMSFYNDT